MDKESELQVLKYLVHVFFFRSTKDGSRAQIPFGVRYCSLGKCQEAFTALMEQKTTQLNTLISQRDQQQAVLTQVLQLF